MDLAEFSCTYKFMIEKARRSVSVLLVSLSLLLLLSIKFKYEFFQISILGFYILDIVIPIYLLFLIVFVRRLIFCNQDNLKIEVKQGYLYIPTFFLGVKKIPIRNVYSVERVKLGQNIIALVLGISGSERYVIEKERFVEEESFFSFASSIQSFINSSIDKKRGETITRLSENVERSHTYSSLCIFLLCLVIFAISSGDERFILSGGNTQHVFLNSEYYRLFSSAFIHLTVYHLLINLFVLGLFSVLLEKLFSSIRYLNIFLVCNFAGALSSNLFADIYGSVGASGGLYGLWGAYTYLKIRYEHILPGSINTIPNSRLYLVLVLEVLLELFVLENVDYINHLGGFVMGFVYLSLLPLDKELGNVQETLFAEKLLFVILLICFTSGLGYCLLNYYSLF